MTIKTKSGFEFNLTREVQTDRIGRQFKHSSTESKSNGNTLHYFIFVLEPWKGIFVELDRYNNLINITQN